MKNMKNLIKKIKYLMYLFFMLILTKNTYGQIILDPVDPVIQPHKPPVWVNPPLCCDIPEMSVWFSTSTDNGIMPIFLINSGPLPIQEIQISLMDYHVEYNNPNCKPLSMGDFIGNIEPWTGTDGTTTWNFSSIPPLGSPALILQPAVNPPINNSLTWTSTTPINLAPGSGWLGLNFNGLIFLNFWAPRIVNLECCSGNLFYCFKVRITDVTCRVCEKIVCGSFELPKDKRISQSKENNLNIELNKEKSENPYELFKRNYSKGLKK